LILCTDLIRGRGKIDYVKVENFTSLSNEGLLLIQISNVGDVNSEFVCEISCDENILKIEAQRIFLNPNNSTTLQIPVFMKTTIETNNSCLITLVNNVGESLDHYTLNFSVYQLQVRFWLELLFNILA